MNVVVGPNHPTYRNIAELLHLTQRFSLCKAMDLNNTLYLSYYNYTPLLLLTACSAAPF